MLETARGVVFTARRDQNNCAAAHARSLEGTLVGNACRFAYEPFDSLNTKSLERVTLLANGKLLCCNFINVLISSADY